MVTFVRFSKAFTSSNWLKNYLFNEVNFLACVFGLPMYFTDVLLVAMRDALIPLLDEILKVKLGC